MKKESIKLEDMPIILTLGGVPKTVEEIQQHINSKRTQKQPKSA